MMTTLMVIVGFLVGVWVGFAPLPTYRHRRLAFGESRVQAAKYVIRRYQELAKATLNGELRRCIRRGDFL